VGIKTLWIYESLKRILMPFGAFLFFEKSLHLYMQRVILFTGWCELLTGENLQGCFAGIQGAGRANEPLWRKPSLNLGSRQSFSPGPITKPFR